MPTPTASVQYAKPPIDSLRAKLTNLQFRVTQEDATERPFHNLYWDNKTAGIYVDIVSGEPLFSSQHKFKSGTGWPSFTQPLEPDHIVEHTDNSLFMTRVEVRSKYADSHLGHVFADGPPPTGAALLHQLGCPCALFPSKIWPRKATANTRPCLSETRSPFSIAEMQTAGQPHPEVYPAVFLWLPVCSIH